MLHTFGCPLVPSILLHIKTSVCNMLYATILPNLALKCCVHLAGPLINSHPMPSVPLHFTLARKNKSILGKRECRTRKLCGVLVKHPSLNYLQERHKLIDLFFSSGFIPVSSLLTFSSTLSLYLAAARIFSSTLFTVMSLNTRTSFFWPIRCARSWAWRS